MLDMKVEKYRPSIIVVAANSIRARSVKRRMLLYREEGNVKFTKWVSFGDDMVPQMIAK